MRNRMPCPSRGQLLQPAQTAIERAEVDVYSFAGQTGDVILLTVSETGGFSGSLSARVRLLSPTLVEVTTFTTSGQAQVTLPESGTYVITVTGNGGGSSVYPTGT